MLSKIVFAGYLGLLAYPSIPQVRAQESDELVLSKFESPLGDDWYGAAETHCPFIEETDPERVKEGQASGKWEPSKEPWIHLRNCPKDWSPYTMLSVWIYAENAVGQKINWSLSSPNTNGDGDYFLYQMTVNWEGWKQVEIDLDKFRKGRDAKGMNAIEGFMISSKGWGAEESLPDAVLYFDDMRLIK